VLPTMSFNSVTRITVGRDGCSHETGLLSLERLNPKTLDKGDEFANAPEILIVASAVPLNGGAIGRN
jgi:hypothetical protein